MNIDINELRQFMDDIAATRSDFTLFGLFLRDEAPDKLYERAGQPARAARLFQKVARLAQQEVWIHNLGRTG